VRVGTLMISGAVMNPQIIQAEKLFTRNTTSLVVREFQKEDIDKLDNLIIDVWGEEYLDKFKKRLTYIVDHNPHSNPDIPAGIVMLNDNRIVGFMGFILVLIKIQNTKYNLCWGYDFSVSPEYRGRGGKLIAREATNFNCIFSGLPYPRVLILWKRVIKSDFPVDIFSFNHLVRPLSVRSLLGRMGVNSKWLYNAGNFLLKLCYRLFFNIKHSTSVKIEKIDHFDQRFDDFFNQAAEDYPIIIIRDQKYLNWRYANYPLHKYHILAASRAGRLCGYMILRCKEKNSIKNGYLIDYLSAVNDHETLRALIFQAKLYFEQEAAQNIKCIEPLIPSHKRLFKNMGFFKFNKHKNTMLLVNKIYNSISTDVILNPENWFITLNYSDQDMD
jgi:GNAT superfamily N-acetyltransferase